jgi:hypothetical protein
MNQFCKSIRLLALAASLPICLSAQQTTTTTTPKSATHVMTVDSAQVVYVSGDDAVLKMPDGSLRLFEMQPGTPLMIDGKESKPSDLRPGMNIAHVQLHSRAASEVTSVDELNGTITAKNGPFMTIRLDDGTSKIYRVPADATFSVSGKETHYGSIMHGMKVSVTAVTTSPLTSQSTKAAVVANTPPQQGTLVILKR